MFRLDILQYQWLMLALIGGGALVLAMVLSYLAIWRRQDAQEAGAAQTPRQPCGHSRAFMPWILIVAYAFAIIYVNVYTLRMSIYPPDW